MTALGVYKKGQGVYSRIVVGIALGILGLFASLSLHNALMDLPNVAQNTKIPLVDIGLTWGLICSFALFALLGFLIYILLLVWKQGLDR